MPIRSLCSSLFLSVFIWKHFHYAVFVEVKAFFSLSHSSCFPPSRQLQTSLLVGVHQHAVCIYVSARRVSYSRTQWPSAPAGVALPPTVAPKTAETKSNWSLSKKCLNRCRCVTVLGAQSKSWRVVIFVLCVVWMFPDEWVCLCTPRLEFTSDHRPWLCDLKKGYLYIFALCLLFHI